MAPAVFLIGSSTGLLTSDVKVAHCTRRGVCVCTCWWLTSTNCKTLLEAGVCQARQADGENTGWRSEGVAIWSMRFPSCSSCSLQASQVFRVGGVTEAGTTFGAVDVERLGQGHSAIDSTLPFGRRRDDCNTLKTRRSDRGHRRHATFA